MNFVVFRYRAKLRELIGYCFLCSTNPKTIYSEGKNIGKTINNVGYSAVSQGNLVPSPKCYGKDKNTRITEDSLLDEQNNI